MSQASKRRRILQAQEQSQRFLRWQQADERRIHNEEQRHEAYLRKHRQQMERVAAQQEIEALQQRVRELDAEVVDAEREEQQLQRQAEESRAAESAAFQELSGVFFLLMRSDHCFGQMQGMQGSRVCMAYNHRKKRGRFLRGALLILHLTFAHKASF